MSSTLVSVSELFTAYRHWISKNPTSASDYETTAKWISYFIAGKINNSQVLSELVYCSSNLLVLFNDRIINKSLQIDIADDGTNLKLWLTIVEYCEVLLELSSDRLGGPKAKWLIIIAVQVFKFAARLFLIHCRKDAIVQSPPIPALNRGEALRRNQTRQNGASVHDIAQAQRDSLFFTLRSGRLVRKVEASPPIALRTWRTVQDERGESEHAQTVEQALAGRQLLAETLYIVKPVAHLATLACFGQKSWKPWMLSLLIDLTSLQLYGSCKNAKLNSLTSKQKLQVSKRSWLLLMYLIRSPFYEKHSENKVKAFLDALSRSLPLARLICGPISQYLPFYQSTYFYMWST